MRYLLIPVLLIMLASQASAEEITFANQDYWLGETAQAEISFQDFSPDKLSFLDNESNPVQVGFLTKKIGSIDFVYFNLPTSISGGKYHLTAKDQRIIGGVLQDFEISSELVVTEELGMSITPAVISLDPAKDEFKIGVHNMADTSIYVNISTSSENLVPARDQIQFGPHDAKNAFISYDLSGLSSDQSVTFSYLNRTHSVRILVPEEAPAEEEPETIPEETEEPVATGDLNFLGPDSVEKTSSRYTSFSDSVKLENSLNIRLTDIRFGLTGNLADVVEIGSAGLPSLEAGDSFVQQIRVNKDKTAAPGTYGGEFTVTARGGYSDSIAMKFIFEDLALIEESTNETSETLFNKSMLTSERIGVLLNETEAPENTNVRKNITIALSMALVAAFIAIFMVLKLRKRTERKQLKEYAKSLKKAQK